MFSEPHDVRPVSAQVSPQYAREQVLERFARLFLRMLGAQREARLAGFRDRKGRIKKGKRVSALIRDLDNMTASMRAFGIEDAEFDAAFRTMFRMLIVEHSKDE